MDSSEGRLFIEDKDEELPPLYDAVTEQNDADNKSFWTCCVINRTLLPFKAFYYFFYGAIGSLFPFLALYYKHLWLSPTQTGVLVGLRLFVQMFTTPLWAVLADRFHAKKIVLFIGLCGWLFANTSILLVPPGRKPLSCSENSNKTYLQKRLFPLSTSNDFNGSDQNDKHLLPNVKNHPAFAIKYDSLVASEIENFDENSNLDIKRSFFSKGRESRSIDTRHTFFYLFIIIFVGNLFSAPAQTMANTAMLQTLEDDSHKYGIQRCFGSIGWGASAFLVGMLVSMNHDRRLACTWLDDINYTPCFYAFGAFMLCALFVATTFKYKKENDRKKTDKKSSISVDCRQMDYLTMFVCFVVFIAGFNMGFIQTFLFWHLQSLGGNQHLFSIILAFNAIGEMIGFILSVKLISRFGHLNVLALGIFAYAVRCTVYGIVKNAWLVLFVEYLKAFTSSAVWSAAMSYVGDTSTTGSSLSSIVHTLYWGLGYGGGSILGGVFMQVLEARTTFLGLAVISLLVVILILMINHHNCCPKRKREVYLPVGSEEEEDGDN
ncbi:major facilitator superfamily domain-containing protein 6-A-like isoform X2 [Xenia sp. Carnegie-2017]|nr:major facilitator superfamily domain-containing protein 6-A-like isoform X2 [Xenia sp. Carnegie-2017]XP_046848375.1 major facilitator superfamily domain-containing protein 6-A-like isoform X2 [Xenia sp. Carnegie-2017]